MINKKIMNKKECLRDIEELLKKYKDNQYRLFQYDLNWHYIDEHYYIDKLYEKKYIADEKDNIRLEFNDIENQENIIIVTQYNINNLLKG